MTLRDEFESWISLPPFEHMCDRNSNKSAWPGAYKRYETELAWEAYQAAHAKQQKRIDGLKNMLEDVVNEIELSESMIEAHGPLGTAPAVLVRLVLDRKDAEIAMLKSGMISLSATAQEG
jgi:hypothetical protein